MECQANITEYRIKNMLIADKMTAPVQFKQALKLELYGLLSQFMQLQAEDIKLSITVLANGKYRLLMQTDAQDINRKIGLHGTGSNRQ